MQLVMPIISQAESPCALCVSLYGSSCCEIKYDDDSRLPMTYAEASRIARRFKRPIDEVVDVKTLTKERKLQLLVLGPDVYSLAVGNNALYLPTNSGRCRYLDGKDCSIKDIKPHICAMFPFKRVGGAWLIGVFTPGAGFCYGQDAAGNDTSTAMRLFGTNQTVLDRIYDAWQKDLKTHKAQMRKLRS